MLSGWNQSDSFYDTMCGSGTIAIEAALLAYNIAPGLLRKGFAFQKWSDYDEDLFLKIKNKLESDINLDKKIKIHGYDSEFSNIVMAMYSSKLLGLEKYISFKKQNMLDFKPDDSKATLIINPPYGERLGDDDSTKLLYKMIGLSLIHISEPTRPY